MCVSLSFFVLVLRSLLDLATLRVVWIGGSRLAGSFFSGTPQSQTEADCAQGDPHFVCACRTHLPRPTRKSTSASINALHTPTSEEGCVCMCVCVCVCVCVFPTTLCDRFSSRARGGIQFAACRAFSLRGDSPLCFDRLSANTQRQQVSCPSFPIFTALSAPVDARDGKLSGKHHH